MLQHVEQEHGQDGEGPDEVELALGRREHHPEQGRPGDAVNAVRPSRQPEEVVRQGDAHDFHDADGDDQQVVPAQVDDGLRQHEGEDRGQHPGYGHGGEDGPVVHGVEDRGRIRSHGEKGRMPHVEQARLPQDEVEREGQRRIDADFVQHVELGDAAPAEPRQFEDRGHAGHDEAEDAARHGVEIPF